MYYDELLYKEIINTISKEISDKFDTKSSKILIDKVNKIFNETFKECFEDAMTSLPIKCIKTDKYLSKLTKTLKLLSFLDKNIDNFQLINNRRINNPNNKLYVLLWARLNIKIFLEDEYFEYEIFDFYNELFTEYEYLVYYNEFIEDKCIFNILYQNNLWLTDKAINLLKKLVSKHPSIDIFKIILAQIYTEKKELIKALEYAQILLNSLQKESKNYLERKYFYTQLRAEIYYLNNEFDKAQKDLDYLLSDETNNDYVSVLYKLLFSINISLKTNNLKQAYTNSLFLITIFDVFDLQRHLDSSYFPIETEFIVKYINKLAKQHIKLFNKKTNEKSFYFRSNIGKIEVFGSDKWSWQDGIEPFFILKFNNKKSLTIKIQDVPENRKITDFELLENKTIGSEDKLLIIDWLNSKSKLSEKNIGAELTNYQYISIIWTLLNKENNIKDTFVSVRYEE